VNDPIAVKLHDCTSEHYDTRGINICTSDAYSAYDKLLNQLYQMALHANDEEAREAVQHSQRKWISFRDAENQARASYGKTQRGTILSVAVAWSYQMITDIRERISELMFYLGADQN
jgi:uncharacterized protein YecT (DUF1311 family)